MCLQSPRTVYKHKLFFVNVEICVVAHHLCWRDIFKHLCSWKWEYAAVFLPTSPDAEHDFGIGSISPSIYCLLLISRPKYAHPLNHSIINTTCFTIFYDVSGKQFAAKILPCCVIVLLYFCLSLVSLQALSAVSRRLTTHVILYTEVIVMKSSRRICLCWTSV